MRIKVRLYKRFDLDLLSLMDAGYPVGTLMRKSVESYAKGIPFSICLDEIITCNASDINSCTVSFTVKETDRETCSLLFGLIDSYRGAFCKNLLRNALINQNLICYMRGQKNYHLQTEFLDSINLDNFEGMVMASSFRKDKKIKVGDVEVVLEKKKALSRKNIKAKESQKPKSSPTKKEEPIKKEVTPVPMPIFEEVYEDNGDSIGTDELMSLFDSL